MKIIKKITINSNQKYKLKIKKIYNSNNAFN